MKYGVILILKMERSFLMSRPLKTGLDYFPHDTMAHADPKLRSLMALYGPDGYTFYFIMLEIIFRSDNGRITIGKPSEKIGIAHTMCMKLKRFEQVLETALDIGCFNMDEYMDHGVLTSNGVSKRIQKIKEEREADRKRREPLKDKTKYKEKEKAKTGKLPEPDSYPPGKLNEVEDVDSCNGSFGQNSDEFRLSELLLSLIKKRNPSHKDPDLQSWSKHIDYMIRIDKRQVSEIEKIIKACQQDPFWQNNILSTEKLRKQYDQLKLKMVTKQETIWPNKVLPL